MADRNSADRHLREPYIPRSYVDMAVPVLPDGTPLGFGAEGELLDFYLQWLAGHLRHIRIPVPPEQAVAAAMLEGLSPADMAFELPDCLGYHFWDRAIIEVLLQEQGAAYSDILRDERARWEEIVAAAPGYDVAFEAFCTPRSTYERVRQEVAIEEGIPDLPSHLDVFYRPLLALAVKRCATLQEAVQVLRGFYKNFNDCAAR